MFKFFGHFPIKLIADVISGYLNAQDDFLAAASERIVGKKVEVTLTRQVNKFPLPVIMHLIDDDGQVDQNQNPKRTNVARMFKQMG